MRGFQLGLRERLVVWFECIFWDNANFISKLHILTTHDFCLSRCTSRLRLALAALIKQIYLFSNIWDREVSGSRWDDHVVAWLWRRLVEPPARGGAGRIEDAILILDVAVSVCLLLGWAGLENALSDLNGLLLVRSFPLGYASPLHWTWLFLKDIGLGARFLYNLWGELGHLGSVRELIVVGLLLVTALNPRLIKILESNPVSLKIFQRLVILSYLRLHHHGIACNCALFLDFRRWAMSSIWLDTTWSWRLLIAHPALEVTTQIVCSLLERSVDFFQRIRVIRRFTISKIKIDVAAQILLAFWLSQFV